MTYNHGYNWASEPDCKGEHSYEYWQQVRYVYCL